MTVTFSGIVYDESPGTCTVNITGVATATGIKPDANGAFTVTVTATALGEVDAQATDALGALSNTDFFNIDGHKPVIDSLYYVRMDTGVYKIQGHVTDDPVAGIVVYFGGEVKAISGLSAVCDANGYFEVTFTDTNPADIGVFTADCIDWWGVAADQKTCTFNG
jgi:hypothetical protein